MPNLTFGLGFGGHPPALWKAEVYLTLDHPHVAKLGNAQLGVKDS